MKIVILFCLLPSVLGINSTSWSLDNFRRAYEAYNTDGNGKVELNDVQYFFNREDINGDGIITFQEFSAAGPPGTPQGELRTFFQHFDKLDGLKDNMISNKTVLVIFKLLDFDNDDQVSFEEFLLEMNLMNSDVSDYVIRTMIRMKKLMS